MTPTTIGDRDSREWWEALERGDLLLQRCDACSASRWPWRAMCNHCGSFDWTATTASRRGTVASWIVNHHPFGFDMPAPYVVVLVRLAEQDDILVPGAWAGPADGAGLSVDLPVSATVEGTRICWEASA